MYIYTYIPIYIYTYIHVNSLAVDCGFTSVLIYLLREGMDLACLVLFVRTRT